MLAAIDAGAEDFNVDEDCFEITCEPADLQTVRGAIDESGIKAATAEVTMIPQTTVKLEGEKAGHMMRLIDALEEHDDVQNVYANFEIEE